MVTRIVSGLLLGIIFLLLILQSEPWVLLAFGIPHLIAQIEFTSLFPGLGRVNRVLWVVLCTIVWFGGYFCLTRSESIALIIALVTLLALSIPIAGIVNYERQAQESPGRPSLNVIGFSVLAIAFPFALTAAIALRSDPFPFLLLLIGASWVADTAGVFSGKYFGRSKLVPRLSPKKTVEGAVGGILGAGIVWLSTPFLFDTTNLGGFLGGLSAPAAAVVFLGFGMVAASIGICGDLSMSMHKRLAGVKDYGSIIPGHGGVLDRFDAMLFAAPVVYLLVHFI